MATIFDVIFLSNVSPLDPTEGNETAESAATLLGTTFGGNGDPLYDHVQSFAPGAAGFAGGDRSSAYDTNNTTSNDTFSIDGGADRTMDAAAVYDTTFTYADGSAATVQAVVFQDTAGNLFLAPSTSSDPAYQADLEAGPIQSITFNSVVSDSYVFDADRTAVSFMPVIDGTTGDDSMEVGFTDSDGDQITGNSDFIMSGDGNDSILTGDGDNTVFGGAGSDSIITGIGNDSIDGGDGNDTIRGAAGDDTILGGLGDDSIFGNEDNDSIIAGDGADSVYGEFGNDYIEGGAGNDHLEGNEGADTIYGGDGNDWIRGSYGEDEIWGGTGDDYLWGGYNDDVFHIENDFGNDTIDAEAVDETFGDTLDLSAVTDDLIIDLTHVNPEIGSFTDGVGVGIFDEIEHIVLGGGRDTIKLADGSGADTVQAFDMADSGDGTTNDQLDVSALTSDGGTTPVTTADVVVTDTNGDGTGDAILTFRGGESITLLGVQASQVDSPAELANIGIPAASGPDYVVDGTAGADLIDSTYTGDPEGDMVDNLDAADGSNDDYITPGDGNDTVFAGAGNDTVDAGASTGDDLIHGEDGDDLLYGGSGNDTLIGGVGSDTLVGDAGADSLTGGKGGDAISAGADGDTVILAEGDTVLGQGGDDLFLVTDLGEVGANDATIVGGEAGETLGDTIDFQGLTHWDDITYSDTDPGAGGGLSGTATLADGSVVTFSEIENVVICFAAGTRIATATGPREVQTLQPGDLVVTRDRGLQPVRWAGSRTVPARGSLAPVRFEAGVLGNERPLLVSPQHRMLIGSHRAALLFGEGEVLASAKHLENGGSIARQPGGMVSYVHILFDRHEIVYAEGAPSESFFPGEAGLSAVEEAAREELFTLFPELRSTSGGFETTARMCLRGHECRLLRLG